VESCETGADTGNKGTGEFDPAKWETPGHIDSMVQRQASGLGCHCPRQLCRIAHWQHCNGVKCSGEPTKSPSMMNWPARTSYTPLP